MAAFALTALAAAFAVTCGSSPGVAEAPVKMGLLLALYNANVTTDWVRVAKAASAPSERTFHVRGPIGVWLVVLRYPHLPANITSQCGNIDP